MVYKKTAKGFYGKILEAWILRDIYKITDNPKSAVYDLSASNNKLTGRNLSIKSTKTRRICCSDIFNFLNSKLLDLIIIKYALNSLNQITVEYCYLFHNFDKNLMNLEVDSEKLYQLQAYVKSLNHPYDKKERVIAHTLAKLIIKKGFGDFKIHVRLSSGNRRIQCSLNIDILIQLFNPKLLYSNYIVLV